MVNKNILRIRKDLDRLDNKLLEIIKKRVKLVDLVIKNKKYKKDIVDKNEYQSFKKYFKKSRKKNIDPKITNRIWKSMIKTFIEYEFRNFYKK